MKNKKTLTILGKDYKIVPGIELGENMENKKIEIAGHIVKIKGHTITLTTEELYRLKVELEKVFPTPPMIIREPILIPSEPINPPPVYPIQPWTSNPWSVPVHPIIWCTTNGATTKEIS